MLSGPAHRHFTSCSSNVHVPDLIMACNDLFIFLFVIIIISSSSRPMLLFSFIG